MNYEFSKAEKGFLGELKKAALQAATTLDEATSDEAGRNALATSVPVEYQRLLAAAVDQESGMALTVAATEVAATWCPPLALSWEAGLRPLSLALLRHGPEALRQRWLTGEGPLVAWARREGGAEHFSQAWNTQAQAEGEGANTKFRLQGKKLAVVNGGLAQVVAIVGQVGDEMALFLVDRDEPGLTWTSRGSLPGFAPIVAADLHINECLVSADQVVGPLPAKKLGATVAAGENCALLGISLGLMKRSLQAARQQAKQHECRGKPLVARQEVSFPLTEMLTLYQTAQLLAYRSAWSLDQNENDAATLVETAKVFCTEAAERVASMALQVQSLTGDTMPKEGQAMFLGTKYLQLLGTPNEVARSNIGDDALHRWG
jgi:alkylation response protein AidB-like acyl-CoA dehydrogenase